ncbi:hypothetical protein [Lacihabitans soyangensis]|uniref:Uncharacterized protein n=1 Tax=Lacihabitans soyangensis TaxID=869394 RepID=A0AAE3KWD2_9BACT|nr:hypothetical protein [Lacihabitans soyangensis]MCP9762685.1 hypothetical protein [Lacihabitans soyangensis]
MQKLDFVKKLSFLITKLNSIEFIEIFDQSFDSPDNNLFNFSQLVPILFQSKSNYDILNNQKEFKKILVDLELDEIYDSENLSFLARCFTKAIPYNLFIEVPVKRFWSTHQGLVQLLNLTKKLFLNEILLQKNETQLNKGILIFQITIEEDSLDASVYSDIFTNLKELVTTISKIYSEGDDKLDIILLDSGSNTNLAVQTTAETAKSLFLIFKEMWDFFTNHKFYKQKQHNQALLESLTIMQEIKDKTTSGVLTEEQGKEYIHYIKSRTDKLINHKVIPKCIMEENIQIDSVKQLNEMKEVKLLNSGN